MVLVIGLEPIRLLHRGIFKAYASKIDLNKYHKKQGIFSRKPPKNAPKSMILSNYPFVKFPLKSATSQNFPTFFTHIYKLLGVLLEKMSLHLIFICYKILQFIFCICCEEQMSYFPPYISLY